MIRWLELKYKKLSFLGAHFAEKSSIGLCETKFAGCYWACGSPNKYFYVPLPYIKYLIDSCPILKSPALFVVSGEYSLWAGYKVR